MYLGSCRYKLPTFQDDEDTYVKLFRILKELEITDFFYIGGNDSMDTVMKLDDYAKYINSDIHFIGIPKTIDNDIWGTDFSFGFDSAVSIATDAIDRLHSTASSHKRVMVIEVMGHKAGWIALYSGMAGGGDVILIPELSYNIHNIGDTILNRLKKESRIPSLWLPREFRRTARNVQPNISHRRLNTKRVSKPVKRFWGISSGVVRLHLLTVICRPAWEGMLRS